MKTYTLTTLPVNARGDRNRLEKNLAAAGLPADEVNQACTMLLGLFEAKTVSGFPIPPAEFQQVAGLMQGFRTLEPFVTDPGKQVPVKWELAPIPTACWWWDPKYRLHRIQIGSKMFQNEANSDSPRFRGTVLADHLVRLYIAAHHVHEMGHAIVTPRTTEERKKLLSQAAIPGQPTEDGTPAPDVQPSHTIWNLLEDAWMEAYMRQRLTRLATWPSKLAQLLAHTPGSEWTFQWLAVETPLVDRLDLSKGSLSPQHVMLACIQAEGNVLNIHERLNDKIKAQGFEDPLVAELQAKVEQVIDFYQRLTSSMLSAQTQREEADPNFAAKPLPEDWPMASFLKEWMLRFHKAEEEQSGTGNSPSDLQLGELLSQLDPNALQQVLAAASGECDGLPDVSIPSNQNPEGQRGGPVAAYGATVRGSEDQPIDQQRVATMSSRVAQILTGKLKKTWTPTPKGAFHGGRVLNRDTALNPFRIKARLPSEGIHDVVLVLDCSGSMSAPHKLANGQMTSYIKEGVLLAAVLSQLATQGKASGHVILTGVVSTDDGYSDSWERFKLPLAPQVLSKIAGIWGGEGLRRCMLDHRDLFRKAAYVWVFTDGNIGDAPVFDKEEFAGLNTKGLYVANGSVGKNLDQLRTHLCRWFSTAVVHDSVELVLEAILRDIKK